MNKLFKTGKKLSYLLSCLLCISMMAPINASAYEIPSENSNVEFLYVFGVGGSREAGAEDHQQVLFFDVPASESRPIVLKLYDPDTYRNPDSRRNFKWDTKTIVTTYGSAMLDQEVIGVGESEYHESYLTFGPYSKDQGKKIGDFYRFSIEIKGLEGDDQNLFKIDVQPETVETFVEDITFRLASGPGKVKYFYPYIGENTQTLTVRNYDLDPSGGTSQLYDNHGNQVYRINDSNSGLWAETTINLKPGPARFLVYEITRGYQIGANAGIQILDGKGNIVPIYFKGPEPRVAKPAPVVEKPKPTPAPQPSGPACSRFTFDARSSFDPNNDKITYLWDFGDGTTSTEPVVEHNYQAGGAYMVRLTVSDNSGLECETSVSTEKVHVNTPPQAALNGPERTCSGAAVKFDASATKDDQPANLTYHWSFGDGTTAEGASVTKSFAKGGVYDVTLVVDDNAGTSCSVDSLRQRIIVNDAPVADAGNDVQLNLKDSNADYAVSFDGGRSSDANGDNLSYFWDFGDGQTAEGKQVRHVYRTGGSYDVKLRVDDGFGSGCSMDTDGLRVNLNKAPIADAGDAQYVCQGTKVIFNGSDSSGEPGENLRYEWNFGDGNTATGHTVEHTYAEGGSYTAVLTVDDGRGTPVSVVQDSVDIKVNSAPHASLARVEETCVNNKVLFDASLSGDPDGDRLSYVWDFGDGTVVEGPAKISHSYTKGGDYNVRVTVNDGNESKCSVSSTMTRVRINTQPVADAGPNLVCCQEQTTSFDGASSSDPDGDKLTHHWNFGDGNTANTAQASHAYAESGQYNVVFTVDDGRNTPCSVAQDNFVASVNAKPVSVIKIKQS